MDTETRRAASTLVLLAVLGTLVRLVMAGPAPPGSVGYRAATAQRPTLDGTRARAEDAGRPLDAGERIDVNVADATQLMRLPRIGPGLAARIVAHRERHGRFASLDDLTKVPGIGSSVRDAVRPHVALPPGDAQSRSSGPAAVDVNRADAAALQTLPGIGPAKAQAILAARARLGRFRRVEDLLEVPGIGPATLGRLRRLVRIS
jgi:competence protein ComEA